MSYETVAAITQSAALILFLAVFFIVIGYVFWPSNRKRLEIAQREALDLPSSADTKRAD